MGRTFYIDESYDDKTNYIVMAGIIIPSNQWKLLNDAINNLKLKYFHTKEINLKSIRRKNYDKEHRWEKLDKINQDNFNNEFYSLIANSEYKILASILDKKKMNDKNRELLFYLAYGFMIQRYQYYLSENKIFGHVIMDSANNNKEIKNLFLVHKDFIANGVPVDKYVWKIKLGKHTLEGKDYKRTSLDNVYEDLTFMNDDQNNILQVVDLVAAAFSAKVNRGNDIWYQRIKPIIRCSASGNINGYGVKVFPKK